MTVRGVHCGAFALSIALGGCGQAPAVRASSHDQAPGSPDASDDASIERPARPNAEGALERVPVPRAFPEVGVTVADSAGAWCAEFPDRGALAAFVPGQRVAIVFVEPAAVAARRARVSRRRGMPCPTAFPQPRWVGYGAYDLALIDTSRAAANGMPTVTLAVANDALWRRGLDDVVRSDVDGDGVLEEARACTADEGEHFTLWTVDSPTRRRRRAHEYFDWGAMTEPTCREGESGEP